MLPILVGVLSLTFAHSVVAQTSTERISASRPATRAATVVEVVLWGAAEVQPSEMLTNVKTQKAQPISQEMLDADRDRIVANYKSRGFQHARVTVSTRQAKDGEGAVVIFRVVEGPRQAPETRQVRYPNLAEWERLICGRPSAVRAEDRNAIAVERLKGTPMEPEWVKVPLSEVLRDVRIVTGLNVVAVREPGYDEITVTLRTERVSAFEVLSRALGPSGWSWCVTDGLVVVAPRGHRVLRQGPESRPPETRPAESR
jgi:hypothetical protein